MSPETIRIPGLDTEWARQLLGFLEAEQPALGAALKMPGRRPDQIQCAFFAAYSLDLASLHYALGDDLEAVRGYLDDAILGHWHLFAQRGTTRAFPWELVTLPSERHAGEGDAPAEQGEGGGGTDTDFSMTNSRKGLLAMYLALVTKGCQVAQELASLVKDPPNATYIGPRSEICTPNEQRLAYASKALLAEAKGTFFAELEGIQDPSPDIAFQEQLLRALEAGKADAFLDHLRAFLDWHRAEWKLPDNLRNTDLFLNLAALGLCEWALERRIISLEALQVAIPDFPVGLLHSGPGTPPAHG